MLNSGYIGLDTRYWHEGIGDWQPVDRIEESVNFPEPSPDEPHAAPPPPRKWSGSLARAIPSPHQLQRKTGPVPLGPTLTAPEKAAVPEPVRAAEVPAPSRQIEIPPRAEGALEPATAKYEPAAIHAPAPPKKRGFKLPRLTHTQLYALSSLLVTLAIVAAIILSRHPAKSPLSKVTLTSRNDYVLVDQPSIKSFEDDMRNSPVADSLKRQIAQSTDPAFVQRITIGMQQETARHLGEVTQQYLRSGKAQVIPPGIYSTVAYFDDNGVLTVTHAGEPWVAIMYKNNIVYAYLGSEFDLTPR
jgi:hypothetical protein